MSKSTSSLEPPAELIPGLSHKLDQVELCFSRIDNCRLKKDRENLRLEALRLVMHSRELAELCGMVTFSRHDWDERY